MAGLIAPTPLTPAAGALQAQIWLAGSIAALSEGHGVPERTSCSVGPNAEKSRHMPVSEWTGFLQEQKRLEACVWVLV